VIKLESEGLPMRTTERHLLDTTKESVYDDTNGQEKARSGRRHSCQGIDYGTSAC